MHSFMDSKVATIPCLTLASGSEIRRRLLEQVGLPHVVRPVRIDEPAIRASLEEEGAGPRDVADALAEFKARKAGADGLVLGCDQVLALKTELFGKAETRDAAASQLARLSGQTHHLYAAAVLYEDDQPVWRHVGIARMSMHVLTEQEIDEYLDRCWPEVGTSVGCYQAEAIGARLFSRIEGDWYSVLGLPLLELCSYLRLRGWRFS